jgi:hypothetical protein
MMDEPNNSLVPTNVPPVTPVTPGHPAVRLGTAALSALVRSPAVRKAALVGAAFGVGFQVSRLARSGSLPQIAGDVKDLYRVANGGDPSVDGRLAGGWVRESFTVISAVYGFLDRDEDATEL